MRESGQLLVRGIDNHRLESEARLKATDAGNLTKPFEVTFTMRHKVAQSQDELLKCIKNHNPGLHIEHWRIFDK
jgi:hypothetical protein